MREYEKYEFCKDIKCRHLCINEDRSFCNLKDGNDCVKNAWEFHNWLKTNGFQIVKKEENHISIMDLFTGPKDPIKTNKEKRKI